jgi:hypothetical protein
MKLQPGKDLYTLVTEALEETGFSFLVKREENRDILKTKGAIYVNKEGNVVEYEDKPTDRVEYYNSFWCAFAFRRRNFFECINFMEKSTLKQKHTINEITQTPIFGSKVFDEIYCAGDFRKPKKEILQSKYSGTNYMWIEDRIDYAKDGLEVGLKTYLMDWPYNREGWTGPRVKSWKDIYDATHRS